MEKGETMEKKEELDSFVSALKDEQRSERETRCLFAAILRAHALRQDR